MLDLRFGDGIRGLRALRDVALVLTDLPSGRTRASTDRPVHLAKLWDGVDAALTDRGVVVILASHLEYAAEVVASRREWFRYELIWRKGRASGHLNARKRPLRGHEYILVFTRSTDTVYNPQNTTGHAPMHKATGGSSGRNYNRARGGIVAKAGSTERLPTSVWDAKCVATNARDRIHHQQKPVSLLRRLVLTYSDPGDLVVDPCAGSGSTGRAALAEGRRFVGFETDAAMVAAVEGANA